MEIETDESNFMLLNCLIIDDEPLSQDVLIDYARACPELILAGVCSDALEAGEMIQKKRVDLLFLDINMPLLSGINFIRSLKNPPLFIFITAYPEFAVEGFEVDAVDYLVKPVSFERFRTAVNRALDRFGSFAENQASSHLMVRADKKNYKLDFSDILYLEAQGDYVRFYTNEKVLTVHGTLKDFIKQLPENQFERIHKSYVVSLPAVQYIEGNLVKIGDYKIPVSLSFREPFLKRLEGKNK